MIFEATSQVKATMNEAVKRLCGELPGSGDADVAPGESVPAGASSDTFSATDYLFVSSRVARAFPDMLESSLILAYRSRHVAAVVQRPRGAQKSASQSGQSDQRVGLWPCRGSIGFSVASLVLIFGGQSVVLQEFLVYCITPLILGGMSVVGSFISQKTYIAIPLGFTMVIVLAVVAYQLPKVSTPQPVAVESVSQQPGRGLRKDKVLPLSAVVEPRSRSNATNAGKINIDKRSVARDVGAVTVSRIDNNASAQDPSLKLMSIHEEQCGEPGKSDEESVDEGDNRGDSGDGDGSEVGSYQSWNCSELDLPDEIEIEQIEQLEEINAMINRPDSRDGSQDEFSLSWNFSNSSASRDDCSVAGREAFCGSDGVSRHVSGSVVGSEVSWHSSDFSSSEYFVSHGLAKQPPGCVDMEEPNGIRSDGRLSWSFSIDSAPRSTHSSND